MKKQLMLLAFVVAFIWLIITSLDDIQEMVGSLARGSWQWILVAALLQAAYYLLFTAMFRSAFKIVKVESRINDLLPVALGTLFINTIAPTWGVAGAALFVDDASHRGQSPARATAGTLLAQIADYSMFAIILVSGLSLLSEMNELKSYEVAGGAILILAIIGLSSSLLLGFFRPDLLKQGMILIQGGINDLAERVHHRPPLGWGWAEKNVCDFAMAAKAIWDHPQGLSRTLGLALGAHVANILSLYALFLAFHQQIGARQLVAGYAIGILFWDISPIPQGIGVVEGVMTLVYSSMGVPVITSTVVVLAFRGLDFWLPMIIGFFLLRRVRISGEA